MAKDPPAGSGSPGVPGLPDEPLSPPAEAAGDETATPASQPTGGIAGYFAPDAPAPASGEPGPTTRATPAAAAPAEAADQDPTPAGADDDEPADLVEDVPVGETEAVGDIPAAESAESPSAALDDEAADDADMAGSADDTDETDQTGRDDDSPRGDWLGRELPDPDPFTVSPAEADELDDESDDDTDDDSVEDEDELDEATAAVARASSTRPVRQAGPAATPKAEAARKNRPTRTRAEATATREAERTTPLVFVNQSVQELKKVVWPTGAQLRQFFIVVLVFVLFMIALVSLLDVGIGQLVLTVFGG